MLCELRNCSGVLSNFWRFLPSSCLFYYDTSRGHAEGRGPTQEDHVFFHVRSECDGQSPSCTHFHPALDFFSLQFWQLLVAGAVCSGTARNGRVAGRNLVPGSIKLSNSADEGVEVNSLPSNLSNYFIINQCIVDFFQQE